MYTNILIDVRSTINIYTLSLHDALPIWEPRHHDVGGREDGGAADGNHTGERQWEPLRDSTFRTSRCGMARSEEHTSELQSHVNLVCRLLLEKKKKQEAYNQCHENSDAKK